MLGQEATTIYTGGDYARIHSDWHLKDAPQKAYDLLPAIELLATQVSGRTCCIADIGTGVGGVPGELLKEAATRFLDVSLNFIGYEIATEPVSVGQKLFPDITFRNRFLSPEDGPFDAVMFVDVLEHLENPWEMLRLAAKVANHMIVRQPLLDNLGIFRRDKYESQRKTLGHIAYFNCRSFQDMAAAAGWVPLQVQIVAPWELGGSHATGGTVGMGPLKRLVTRLSRETASTLFEGFYLTGIYQRRE